MAAYLLVALGGALGSVGRYWTGLLAARLCGESFPWGTLLINVLGSFVIGFAAASTRPDGPLPASLNVRTFIMVGICGGYTTFSSFSLQTLALLRGGSAPAAVANIGLSLSLCLLAVYGGAIAGDGLPVRG
jgi:CrcB protein